jgi:hypothetical protein
MDVLGIKEILLLVTNTGAFGLFAVLFWRRLMKITDTFAEKMESMEQRHRKEMTDLAEKYHELTEKALETMIKLDQARQP